MESIERDEKEQDWLDTLQRAGVHVSRIEAFVANLVGDCVCPCGAVIAEPDDEVCGFCRNEPAGEEDR